MRRRGEGSASICEDLAGGFNERCVEHEFLTNKLFVHKCNTIMFSVTIST